MARCVGCDRDLKKIYDKIYLIGTTVEGGFGETDEYAHIWLSDDMYHWTDVICYKKDIFPFFMGYGRLFFLDDMNNIFAFSGQGLSDFDNRLIIGEII